MARGKESGVLVVFPSDLGWMALIGTAGELRQLTFAHDTLEAAVEALDAILLAGARHGRWNPRLVRQLQAYAAGERVDFRNVRIELSRLSEFQRRVVHHCRQIPYGQTRSYGQLAVAAGSAGAGRAVGNCMAANRTPLIVPCHRVVQAGGRLGAFSAPGGIHTKRRLLELEASSCAIH
jgi:methylated-DNA-[protein]-cysteine S-methyltransferase